MWIKTKQNIIINTSLVNDISVDLGSDCDFKGFDEPYVVCSTTISLSHGGNIYAHPLAGFESERAATLFLDKIFQALERGYPSFDCIKESQIIVDTVKKELETLLQ